jgi:hypothetical protein
VANANGTVVSKTSIGRVQAGQSTTISLSSGLTQKGIYFVQIIDDNNHIATKKVIVQ